MLTTLLPRAAVAAAVTVALLPTSVSADSLAPPSHRDSYGSHGALPGALSEPGGITAFGSSTAVADTGNDRIALFDRHGRPVRDLTGFNAPDDVSATPSGDLVVADTKNNRIKVVSPDGATQLTFGNAGLDRGEFLLPTGVAVAADGSILVSDHANHRIQVFDNHGHWRRTIEDVRWPRGLAVDGERIFVASEERIAVYGTDGRPIGSLDLGWEPWGVAVDPSGRILASGRNRVEVFSLTGARLTRFGEAGSGRAQFGSAPRGLTVAKNGSIHTVDSSGRVHVWRFHTCAGRAATHVGTTGDDNIVGTRRADVIVALDGDDDVRGLHGNDLICLGRGDDTGVGGGGADAIRGGAGDDRLRGGDGADAITGGGGADVIRGGDRDDTLHGGPGGDVVNGGRGDDACTGGVGADVIRLCEGTASSNA